MIMRGADHAEGYRRVLHLLHATTLVCQFSNHLCGSTCDIASCVILQAVIKHVDDAGKGEPPRVLLCDSTHRLILVVSPCTNMKKPCCIGTVRNAEELKGSTDSIGDLPIYIAKPEEANANGM